MDRRQITARLEKLVRNNRFTIAISFPLIGVFLLVSGREGLIPEWLAFNPYLLVFAVTVMALPLIAGIAPIIDRKAAFGLFLLVLFTWAIELTGVTYHIPYGEFSYQRDLGPMLPGDLAPFFSGEIPWALPIFYFPILLNGYLLAVLMLGDRSDSLYIRYPVVVALVIMLDLILDPGAVSLNFWEWNHPTELLGWDDPGIYYGVPVMNYLGWVVSGSIAVGLIHFSFDHEKIKTRLSECEFFLDDLINFAIFWGLVNLYFGNWAAFALTLVILTVLYRADWFDFAGIGTSNQSVSR
ncbi:carotenoid biosynthesis protein [Salinarchaeum sp. IM2453]|uniref:bisanhydrobacterioruberin hydratase n=1 Tax=Salinarchaeum sp. IM2453 TaxID=2862870 RepID=UPI001C8286F8|nr:bisanhydrobacterioruberin hydratase [Salinarchaeum sp. IM2453]QZA87427.1 carotenoid biosynthesis protein [Salinarchaeum sp. IM2453]